MVTVHFFAGIREQLGIAQLAIAAVAAEATVADLRRWLIEEHGEAWESALCGDNIVTAVNQEVCDVHHRVTDGDEVAFYPPVTGG